MNAKRFLIFMVFGVLMIGLIGSCKHEPFIPIAGGGNPDTTGNGGGGGGGGSTKPCDPDSVYFVNDILPILASNCAMSGCHDAITAEDDIILTNYANVISSDVIDPFDLNGSEMYEVITETDPDKIMPPPPNSPLTAMQISMIATWINQGAKNNYCDGCDTTNITYSLTIEPIINNSCKGCHSGATPSGNLHLENYFDVSTVALNGKLVGAINGTTGYVSMPYNSNPLPDCEIDKIELWVNQGAPNN